jgi:hypothetical protein
MQDAKRSGADMSATTDVLFMFLVRFAKNRVQRYKIYLKQRLHFGKKP